jgi:GNAT superfamily N-acetyltransferase
MPLSFTDDLVGIDWDELSALYRIAPLGDKSAPDLKFVFTSSMYRLFAHDAGALVGAGWVLADGRDCACLCDIAVHADYQGKGLGKDVVGPLVRLSASQDRPRRCGRKRGLLRAFWLPPHDHRHGHLRGSRQGLRPRPDRAPLTAPGKAQKNRNRCSKTVHSTVINST